MTAGNPSLTCHALIILPSGLTTSGQVCQCVSHSSPCTPKVSTKMQMASPQELLVKEKVPQFLETH